MNTRTEDVLYQKTHSSSRPPPKVILKDAWQVRHEDGHQRGTSTGQPVADEGKMELKIDFRIQEILHAAVEQEEDRSALAAENPEKEQPRFNPSAFPTKRILQALANENTMEGKMITNRGFLFSPRIPAKDNRDLAKDPRIPENGRNDFPV